MIILRDSTPVPAGCKGAVLAIGNFDGLHLGHRAIISTTLGLARTQGKTAGILTFEPHPRRVFRPDLPMLKIFPFRRKVELLGEMGADFVRVVRFTRAFSQTTAADFVHMLLHRQLQVSHVVTGEDFIFGHQRTGNAALLKQMGEELGFAATACEAVLHQGERCSSTRLRALLAEGNMAWAATLMGRPYSISGRVQPGDQRGRELGFPTANILPPPVFLPATGVYAVRTIINGTTLNGVANLGRRPTFNGSQMRLEVHLFDWQGDLYGQTLMVSLVAHLRHEQKFASVDALRAQIQQDCLQARRVLNVTT